MALFTPPRALTRNVVATNSHSRALVLTHATFVTGIGQVMVIYGGQLV
jgi:hypothetical protein